MKHPKISAGSSITQLALVVFAASIILLPLPGAANDLNVHPASCAAPFLNQAFPMRWHEHFLLNPTNNVPTWLICPLNFDNDTLATSFTTVVIGRPVPGAEETLPQCYLTFHSAFNMQLGDYATGTPLIYTQPLETSTMVEADVILWVAEGSTVGPPPSEFEQASVYCRLPAGYALSGISLSDDIRSE